MVKILRRFVFDEGWEESYERMERFYKKKYKTKVVMIHPDGIQTTRNGKQGTYVQIIIDNGNVCK